MKGHIKSENLEHIVIDAGVVYLNYGVEGKEKLLAPCKGDNAFSVEAEIREIEANGLKGKTKGLRRKIREEASLTVNLMDLSLDNLKSMLPGSKKSATSLKHGWKIEDEDYIDNVTIIGEELGGGFKKITIYNALSDEPTEVTLIEDDETAVAITFSAHFDLDDGCENEADFWEIEDLTEFACDGA